MRMKACFPSSTRRFARSIQSSAIRIWFRLPESLELENISIPGSERLNSVTSSGRSSMRRKIG